METLGFDRLAEGLREQADAVAAVVEDVPAGTTVPTCPLWTVKDLVGHLGQAHRWAADIVRTRAAAAFPDPLLAEPGEPPRWPHWLRDGAAELIDAVSEAGASSPLWTPIGPRPAVFWLRRMLAETVVHHADAALTAGKPYEIAADLAEDVISEAMDILSAPNATSLRAALAELRGDGQTLRWHPRDLPAGWRITRTPDGFGWDRSAAGADVTVTGPVRDLMLVLARRLPPGDHRVEVTGDRELLDHWLAATAL
ncbi:maleylpyruvate isomerase family mycothiol-dependent enzyme [Amycolatopsis sp. NPDC059021]|uniref:maleylpyruvate isomerase family mycothiol-dependent enzyme n=1 Tax=Amycolatopsis sp. NPDC059021 TaxID=3346704 RepID=UPI00366BA533